MQNLKVYLYVLGLTTVVALLLAGLQVSLADIHKANEALATKRDILGAIKGTTAVSEMADPEVETYFDKNIEQVVVTPEGEVVADRQASNVSLADEEKKPEEKRHYPLFIHESEEGKQYIMAMRGNGLWDKIWGYIAVEDDYNTIVGVAFDHKSETPGLGAEIKDNENFKKQFAGVRFMDDEGDIKIKVRKGGAVNEKYQVDGISGATVTADGVTDMLRAGIKNYLPYFKTKDPSLEVPGEAGEAAKQDAPTAPVSTTSKVPDTIATEKDFDDSVDVDNMETPREMGK